MKRKPDVNIKSFAGFNRWLMMLSTAALFGCAAIATPAGFELQPAQMAKRETSDALQTYAQALRKQNAAEIALLFVPKGTMQHTGQALIAGRAQIQVFLETFANYKVLSQDMTMLAASPATTRVSQSGSYVQSVRTLGGGEITARGWFIIQWQKQADGGWLVERVNTSSGPPPEGR